jgi:uncharacterized protein YutE (UPF0331/DUF86 family)
LISKLPLRRLVLFLKQKLVILKIIGRTLRIIGLRNLIIHGYDTVSDESIWGIITIHLPKLKIEVDSPLK